MCAHAVMMPISLSTVHMILHMRNGNEVLKYIYNWDADIDCLGDHIHVWVDSPEATFRSNNKILERGITRRKESGPTKQTA